MEHHWQNGRIVPHLPGWHTDSYTDQQAHFNLSFENIVIFISIHVYPWFCICIALCDCMWVYAYDPWNVLRQNRIISYTTNMPIWMCVSYYALYGKWLGPFSVQQNAIELWRKLYKCIFFLLFRLQNIIACSSLVNLITKILQ